MIARGDRDKENLFVFELCETLKSKSNPPNFREVLKNSKIKIQKNFQTNFRTQHGSALARGAVYYSISRRT